MDDYQWEFGRAAICEDWSVITEPLKNIVRCFLWNSVSNQTIELPSLEKNRCLFKCVLSSPPTKPDCMVIFLVRDCPFFIFCRVGDSQFTTLEYAHTPDDDLSDVFVDLIVFNSKLYGIKASGKLCLIDVVGPHLPKVELVGMSSGNWYTNWHKRLQLVECCGDLLVVRRQSLFLFEVVMVDLVQRRKTKVLNLGDQVLVLSHNYSVSLSARELGVHGNCIYFVDCDDDDDTFYVFNLGDKSLSTSRNQPEMASTFWFSRDGLLPILRGHSWEITETCWSSKKNSTAFRSFLVPVGEELFSVFLTRLGKSTHVFKLVGRDWEEVNGLKNQMLFASQTSTLAIRTTDETMKNTLFFPTFNSSQKNVFYSFKNRRFRTIKRDDYSSEDLYETKEILCSTWIIPLGSFVIG